MRYKMKLRTVTVSIVADRDPSEKITDADVAAAACRAIMDKRKLSWAKESFLALYLDTRCRLIGFDVVATGTLNSCLLHPREVFAPALKAFAAQIIVAHNHPSGDTTPSDEDLAITARLAEAGTLLGVPLVDSLVFTPDDARSIT